MSDENVTIEGAGAGTRIVGKLLPHRDDAVATWLKMHRDEIKTLSPGYDSRAAASYDAIDALLDEYRLRADVGSDLATEVAGEEQR